MDQREIEKSAKKIMDSFMEALEKVGETQTDFVVKRDKNVREEDSAQTDDDFQERMFDNAPKVKSGCIVAEKKKW